MKRDVLITTVLLFFLLGISFVSTLVFFSIVVVLMMMAVMVWVSYLRKNLGSGSQLKRLLLLAALAMLIGVTRFSVDYLLFPLHGLDIGFVQIMGQVTALPDRNGLNQDLQVEVIHFELLDATEALREDWAIDLIGAHLAVRLPAQMVVGYGDRLLLSGRLVGAGNVNISPNFQQKLFRQKLWGVLESAVVRKRLGNSVFDPSKMIFNLRDGILHFFSRTLSEPAASLVNGVLIGERSNIPVTLSKAFQITGLTHILAISGFNITLIINLLIIMTGAWPRALRMTLTVGLIAMFVILTGASASVVRAAVMGILFLLVKNLGRRVKAFKAILFSVSAIVVVEPRLLNFDISFQLSVLATLSLILFSSVLLGKANKSWRQLLWEGMATTLAAQVITLPFIFYHFGTISLISPVANLLIGPLIPLLMLLGVIVLVVGVVFGPLVILVAGLTQLVVATMTVIILTLAKVPLAQLEFGQGMLWLVILYYGILFILSRKYKLVPDFF